jgi:hypothetical protein
MGVQVNSRTFVLLDTSPHAFFYSHLVFCAKFAMPMIVHRCNGTIPTYTLKQEVEETILQALAYCQLLESRDQ